MKRIVDKYKFSFRRGTSLRVPFKYSTLNDDGTRTLMILTGKRISIRFRQRGAVDDMLALDTSQTANAFGAQMSITNVNGEWEIYVPIAQIEQFPIGYGEWEMLLQEADGGSEAITEGAFNVK